MRTPSPERAAASGCSLLLLAYFPGDVKARFTARGARVRAAELPAGPEGASRAEPSPERPCPAWRPHGELLEGLGRGAIWPSGAGAARVPRERNEWKRQI